MFFPTLKDNPVHNVPILGGLWGYANIKNRKLGHKMLNIITNKHISNRYLENGMSKKGWGEMLYFEKRINFLFLFYFFIDQDFLHDFIYKYAKKNATIHDSYTCKEFEDSEPFPTQRHKSFCYVSCHHCCDSIYTKDVNKNVAMQEFPLECRPKLNLDWKFC